MRYEVTTTTNAPLIPGQHITGTSVGRHRKSGRTVFTATWSGVYVGVQHPDPTDLWLDAHGAPAKDQGGPIHLFRDGEINGVPQAHHGFPVEQYAGIAADA